MQSVDTAKEDVRKGFNSLDDKYFKNLKYNQIETDVEIVHNIN